MALRRAVLACLCAGALTGAAVPTAPAFADTPSAMDGGASAPAPAPEPAGGVPAAPGAPLPAPAPVPAGPHGAATLAPNGTAVAPVDAPPVVKAIIAAGNRIARKPYVWGGGHGSWIARGYDCSGSVSFALHGAGLLTSPLVSGSLAGWGAPGRGSWVTIYANAGHVFMSVAGLRFDTSGRRTQHSSRWQVERRSARGYRVRHVPGL